MDAATAVVTNQAMLQQTLALAALKQSAALPQAAAQMLANAATPAPEGNAPSVPAGTTGRVLDILV
ncbi:hypothetical protein [Oleispirillum naphthae]|uniref:hypothetical protein n=1 Tax=Oleispirillum naphthae TaxID=2838853 RepID=UPI0030824527